MRTNGGRRILSEILGVLQDRVEKVLQPGVRMLGIGVLVLRISVQLDR